MTALTPDRLLPARADFLVSVAIVGMRGNATEIEALQALARSLEDKYQFWEILIVLQIASGLERPILDRLAQIPNIRVLRVDNVDSFYRLRLAAVSEAIGDVVLLTSGEELTLMNLPLLANRVYETNEAIVMTRRSGGGPSVILRGLGYSTGYHIDSRDTLTAGFPRSWLSEVLSRPDAELLLRFEKRSGTLRLRHEPVPSEQRVPRPMKAMGRRVYLLADLLASAAPRALRAVSALSLLVTLIAIIYGVYAVLIWLFKADVAPGWLTTSLLQSLIAGFLGVALSTISIGIVKLFDRFEGILHYTIVEELSNVDFFNDVKDLNVEIDMRDKAREAGE